MNREKRHLLRVLKESMGEPGTETITRYVQLSLSENNNSMFNTHFKNLVTKDEFSGFKNELTQFRGEVKDEFVKVKDEFVKVKDEFAKVRSEFKSDIARLEIGMAKTKGELEVKISDTKADIIRWMFAFFVTTILLLVGLYFKK